MYQDTLTIPEKLNLYGHMGWLAVFIIIVFIVGANLLVLQLGYRSMGAPNTGRKSILIGSITGLLIVSTGIWIFNLYQTQQESHVAHKEGILQNVQDLKDNVNTKYEIDDIQEKDSVSKPLSEVLQSNPDINVPVVITVNGDRLVYNLIQDPKTFEPTLQNMPINSDTMDSNIPDAKEFLKESN